ncbi:MAG: hypothetical protein JWO95_2972 [Verrucomicrobiales bacterium]|nr:hypothetical protein [Verrucomicrobiales bacterium]
MYIACMSTAQKIFSGRLLTFVSILFVMLGIGVPLRAQTNATNFFPIMAWNTPPSQPAVYQKMAECGLNVAGFVPVAALDMCQSAGLKAIVSDPRCGGYDWAHVDERVARSNITSLINQVGKHPAVYGYYLRDEPPPAMLPGLARVAALLREASPGKWPYINLYPNYADNNQLEGLTYPQYVQLFVTDCRPTFISYDHYALMDDGTLRNGFWLNLEQVSASSRATTIPFCSIVLSVGHFNYRDPSAADLRFEVYSALSYGARALAYFTYFAPPTGNYRGAPIDQFGNPTPAWYNMQNVNLQVQKLAPTLLQLTCNDTYHFKTVPEGSHGPRPTSLVTGCDGGDFACGEFTHHDRSRYVLLTNKDVVKSAVCQPHYIRPPSRVQKVSPYSGALEDFGGENVWVQPGQGVLLKVSY